MPKRRKIAILGGGMGGLSSAYWLTNQPGWQDKFEITVYEGSWRLGGKGASGRNRKMFDRIEEHGFHMFLGFYENAFAMMRACYEELGRGSKNQFAEFCAKTIEEERADPQRYAMRRQNGSAILQQ